MCCGGKRGPKWKREVVKDHKFDYIDIDEFIDTSCPARSGYVFMYFLMLKGFAVYVADLYTAVSLLVIGNSSLNVDSEIPADVAKWIFLGAIMISFLLLFWDIIKSRAIIESKDISLSFFSLIANRWYSTKDYKYFCLFRRINNSTKLIDTIAFFVFFTLKGWKKILLAEAPRQVINIVTLIAITPKWIEINKGTLVIDNSSLGKNLMQQIMTGTMMFSVIVFAISFVLMCIAAAIYIPLLCHIQGNLKEYCCHKVDKRIEELIRKQARKRLEKSKKGYDKKHHHNKKEQDIEMHSLPQPTLPQVDMNQPGYHYGGHQQQPSYSSGNYYPQPQQRPVFYQQTSSSNASTVVGSNYGGRRNSLSSVNSDQIGLTSHAQPQPRSSPFLGHSPYPQQQQHNNNYNYQPYQQQQHQQQQQQHQNYY